jgi:hypothetical protein
MSEKTDLRSPMHRIRDLESFSGNSRKTQHHFLPMGISQKVDKDELESRPASREISFLASLVQALLASLDGSSSDEDDV